MALVPSGREATRANTLVEAIPLVEQFGDPFTMGVQYGISCGAAIRRFLTQNCAYLLPATADEGARLDLLRRADAYGDALRQTMPDLSLQVSGLAEGAGISHAEATLLQFRRELAGEIASGAECTLVAADAQGGSPVLAQNIDLGGYMAKLGTVLRVDATGAAPRMLIYTFAGLLGFVGMNDAGLAIGINYVAAVPWRRAPSPYLLVRHLLACRSIDECLAVLPVTTWASSRTLTLVDRSRAITIEFTGDCWRVLEGHELFHANHYLHPDLVPRDVFPFFSRNASRQRQAVVTKLWKGLAGDRSADALFGMLSDHSVYPLGLCAHADEGAERDETVAAVVMHPACGTMSIRRGHPCSAITQEVSF